ncbi:hypothetical protein [Affinibrenneria salicis]|nr:hypothetical protein [Affinibrenneria salicis]
MTERLYLFDSRQSGESEAIDSQPPAAGRDAALFYPPTGGRYVA